MSDYAEVHATNGPVLGSGKYVAVMLAIAIGELALNVEAFQVFQKPLYLTLLMSLIVAIGLPTIAHLIGVLLRQRPAPLWRTVIYLTLSFTVGVVFLNGIEIARAQYLATGGRLAAAGDEVAGEPFFYTNLLVFGTAILASYFAHGSDQSMKSFEKVAIR